MPTESEFRDELDGVASSSTRKIDPDDVVRQVRARRAPKQIVVSSASVLAIAGVLVLAVSFAPSLLSNSSTATDSMAGSVAAGGPNNSKVESGDPAPQAPIAGSDTEITGMDRCGAPLSTVAPNPLGLVLTADFAATASANGQPVKGTVTLTNTGTTHVNGSTAVQALLSVSRDSVTVWHSNGALPSMAVIVDLAPGESMTYPAAFTPVVCSPDDDARNVFPQDLPPLGPGPVTVKATIEFVPGDAVDAVRVLVSGPTTTVELR